MAMYVSIGLTGIDFYSANGSVSSSLRNNNDGSLNINSSILNLKTVVGTTGSFKEISGLTGIFNNILTTKIGAGAGAISQGTHTVAFGNNAGNDTQGSSSVAIGNNAGSSLQGSSSVAIGNGAGASKQSYQSVAIGNNAGISEQSYRSVAIGYEAGKTTQEMSAVAIGYNAGNDKQGSSSVAIGDRAGNYSQCEISVAIGSIAGYNYQGTGSIAIGNNAGSHIQNPQAIAIGLNAGSFIQGTGSIAIGLNAGRYNQGNNSIAIGNNAGPTGMSSNSIILNASGTALYYTGPTGGFFVAPIQTTSVVGQNMILGYGPDKQIIGLTGDALAQFGIGSSTGTSSDPFLLANFINPPSVPDTINVTGSSSDIYVIYNCPKQTNFGIGLLPAISSLNIIVGNTGTSNFTGFTGTSSDFIKSTSTSNVVECINISKQKAEGFGNYNGKRMYTIRYPNLPNTNPNPNFYLWYANSSLSKSMYSTYLSYINSGLPSLPTLMGRPTPPTINSIPFTFKGSDKIDTVDPTSSADLRFNIYYAPVSNTKRYNGPVGVTGEYKNILTGPSSSSISYNTSGNFFNVTGNTGLNYSGTITSAVYPDTTYSVDVNASNSISSGFTGISLGNNFITQPSLPPTFVSSGSNLVTLSGLISGRSVSGSTVFTNILPPNISSSFTQTFPIHNTIDSRGATGATPLVTFTSSVTGPAGTITGPSASYTGFGASYVYGTSSANNINMTLSTPTDVTGLAGYDGYYLRGNVTTAMTPALTTNSLVASATPYALSVTGSYSSNNSAVSANYYAPFYYDGQQTPVINGTPNLSVVNGNTGAVCGVPVSKGSITLSLTTTVSGLGNNFYFNGSILNYTSTNGSLSPSSETTLNNLASGTTISTNGRRSEERRVGKEC
jgi:sorbitol-specific phosphotransferase system component IIA